MSKDTAAGGHPRRIVNMTLKEIEGRCKDKSQEFRIAHYTRFGDERFPSLFEYRRIIATICRRRRRHRGTILLPYPLAFARGTLRRSIDISHRNKPDAFFLCGRFNVIVQCS